MYHVWLLVSGNKNFAWPTVWHVVWPLALFVNHNDDHQDEDFYQHTEERPERGQVTAHPQNSYGFFSPNDVRGSADILARVCTNVKIYDIHFRVIVFVHDEEAPSTVVNVLQNTTNVFNKKFRMALGYAYKPCSLKECNTDSIGCHVFGCL